MIKWIALFEFFFEFHYSMALMAHKSGEYYFGAPEFPPKIPLRTRTNPPKLLKIRNPLSKYIFTIYNFLYLIIYNKIFI